MRPETMIEVTWEGSTMIARMTAADGEQYGGRLDPVEDERQTNRNQHDFLYACCHHAHDLGGAPKIAGYDAEWVPAMEKRFA